MRTKGISRAITVLLIVLCLAATAYGGQDDGPAEGELFPIKGASMPNATGFPIWLAKDLGFLEDNGLDLEIVYFQSGAPMVEAGVQGSAWQVGWIGSPPGMTAAAKWGLILAGMEIEEGRQLGVWVRTEELGSQDPAEFLRGKDVMVPVNSTLDQTLGAVLEYFGLTRDDINIVPLGPDDIDASFAAGQGDAAAPFLRPGSPWVEEPDKYTMIANAADAGVRIYDPFIVHPKFWESNPLESAAYIDAVYKANEWILANRDAAVDKMAEFYVEIGTDASRSAVEADVDARTWFTLDMAIDAYASGEALEGYIALAEFFVSVGNWESVPDIQPAVDAGLEVLRAAKDYRESN